MRPADTFEPGFDTVTFTSPRKQFAAAKTTGEVKLTYAEAMALAHSKWKWKKFQNKI